MTKSDIENAALAGLPLDGRDVARVRRSRNRPCTVITYRHVWRDDTDGRVWAALHRAVARLAQGIADAERVSVEVYSAHGCMLEQYAQED